jgi:hypothetical protein
MCAPLKGCRLWGWQWQVLLRPSPLYHPRRTPPRPCRRWNTFARNLLMLQLCWFLLWLVSFNVFTIAFQDEDLSLSLHQV